ncbi:MAG: AbrB/MazE/SpoVT family DNA-binding domain-containing protein [Thermoproteota archaeon]|nr:AbrB/MazE/SpoVT family DNA-binding domain-containing protein [Candidatus Brockarchaeota archaeon]
MQLVSVTRKGQVTIPEEVRRRIGIRLGTKLLVDSIGKEYVLMKKVEMARSMDELQRIGRRIAKQRRLTPYEIRKEIEKIRAEIWKKKYARRYGR